MAIFYTDNLTGNDTTGDGSIANPFKTILKAYQTCANNDTIRVAGSGFTSTGVSATITETLTSTIPTTSSLVGVLNSGDVITIVDPVWPENVLLYKVWSVSATNIVLNAAIVLPPGNYVISKLDQIHYAITSNIIVENNTTALVNKDNVSFEGGWTSGFTQQNGFTAFVFNAVSASQTGGTAFSAWNGTNLKFNNFAFVSFVNAFQLPNANMTTRLGNIWWSSSTAYTSVFNPTMLPNPTPGNLYVSGPGTSTGSSNTFDLNGDYEINFDKVFISVSSGAASSSLIMKMNEAYVVVSGTGSFASTTLLPVITTEIGKVYVRFRGITGEESSQLLPNPATGIVALINDMEFLNVGTSSIKTIGIRNPSATSDIQINLPSPKRIEDMPLHFWTFGSSFQSVYGGTTYVYDSEGSKVLKGLGGITYFADSTEYSTGTNSLRVKSNAPYSVDPSSGPQAIVIDDFVASGSAQTVTLKLKASVARTYTLGFICPQRKGPTGGATGLVIMNQNFSITTSWADYTLTGLETLANYQRYANANIKIVLIPQSGLPLTTPEFVWVDSVTLS